PIVTQELFEDERFLRNSVKESGVRSFICVPLLDFGDGTLGSLNLAWHKIDLPLQQIVRLLEIASVLVSNTLIAGITSSRISVKTALSELKGPSLEEWCRGLLKFVQDYTRARMKAMFLLGLNLRLSESALPQDWVGSNYEDSELGNLEKCSNRLNHHTVEPDDCLNRPGLCLKTAPRGHTACCLPIVWNEQVRGRILLDYGESAFQVQARDMINLAAITGEVAAYLGRGFPYSFPREKVDFDHFDDYSGVEIGLRIQCFGGFEIFWNGKFIPHASFPRKKALTLLKILLLRAGKKVTRDELIETLWPETSFRKGANRLHGVVNALRSVIEPHFVEQRWTYIRREGDRYFFDLDSPHQIDLFIFQDMLERASKSERYLTENQKIYYLQKATDCYLADLFGVECDGFNFEPERERIRQLYIESVERLVELNIRRGELRQAAATLRQALHTDSLQEKFYQTLVKVLIMDGKRKDAREQFHRCVEVLRKEMEVEPLEETMRLKDLLWAPSKSYVESN
ncbi:MAG: BTAD domain-containing putative transcriptional regulator, partial [Desulfatiglandales bacterium]